MEPASKRAPREEPATKKEQVLSLYLSGITEVQDLAVITGARPSYVASVLQEEGEPPMRQRCPASPPLLPAFPYRDSASRSC